MQYVLSESNSVLERYVANVKGGGSIPSSLSIFFDYLCVLNTNLLSL